MALTKTEEQELLRNIDTGGTFVQVTMASGRQYTIGIAVAEWLSENNYLEEVTPDDSALSLEDVQGA
jgi:hypothetical protein